MLAHGVFFSAWKRRNCSWERGNPLLPKRGFPLSQTLSLSQHVLGLHPKTRRSAVRCLPSFLRKLAVFIQDVFIFTKEFSLLALRDFGFQKHFCYFPDVFSAFKRTFVVSPARFRASKELLRLSRRDFGLQKCFRCFPDVFSVFKNTFVACPARFRTSKALSLLPLRIFGLQKYSQGFPKAFLRFGSVPKTSPTQFQRSKVFSLLSRYGFGLQKHFFIRFRQKIIIQ